MFRRKSCHDTVRSWVAWDNRHLNDARETLGVVRTAEYPPRIRPLPFRSKGVFRGNDLSPRSAEFVFHDLQLPRKYYGVDLGFDAKDFDAAVGHGLNAKMVEVYEKLVARQEKYIRKMEQDFEKYRKGQIDVSDFDFVAWFDLPRISRRARSARQKLDANKTPAYAFHQNWAPRGFKADNLLLGPLRKGEREARIDVAVVAWSRLVVVPYWKNPSNERERLAWKIWQNKSEWHELGHAREAFLCRELYSFPKSVLGKTLQEAKREWRRAQDSLSARQASFHTRNRYPPGDESPTHRSGTRRSVERGRRFTYVDRILTESGAIKRFACLP